MRSGELQTAGTLGRRTERPGVPLENDVPYTCPVCFEESYLAIDPSGGRRQRFSEDCPVCCRPLSFTVEIDRAGDAVVTAADLDE